MFFSVAACHQCTPVIVLRYNNMMIVTTKRHTNKFVLLLIGACEKVSQSKRNIFDVEKTVNINVVAWWSLMIVDVIVYEIFIDRYLLKNCVYVRERSNSGWGIHFSFSPWVSSLSARFARKISNFEKIKFTLISNRRW